MQCSEFLAIYTDFRDGHITDLIVLGEIYKHLRACPRCTLYDAAVTQGIGLLRGASDIEPSPAFRRRLRAQLPRRPAPATFPLPVAVSAAVLLMVAAILLLYEGVATRAGLPTAESSHPMPAVVANPGVPFVSFTAQRTDATEPAVVVPVEAKPTSAEWAPPVAP